MLILKILAPVFILVLALFHIALEYKWHDRRTKKHKRVRFLLGTLLILSTIVTVVLVFNDHQDGQHLQSQLETLRLEEQQREIEADSTRASLQYELLTTKTELIASQKIIIAKSDTVANLYGALSEKSDAIVRLNREIIRFVTGGDSFCYLTVLSNPSREPRFMLMHQGEYPLYDIIVRISDLDKPFDPFDTESTVNFGTLPPNQVNLLTELSFQPKDTMRFTIQISARNGSFFESLRVMRLNDGWRSALRVSSGEPPFKVLLEKIDEGYPRNSDGEVVW